MWFIIGMFGIIGGYVTEKRNAKVSDISFTIGYAASTMFMVERMVLRNGEGAMFYVVSVIALVMAILTIISFISFMKKM